MHQTRAPLYDHPRSIIHPDGSSWFRIFHREIFFSWISSGEKWTTRARIASSGRTRRNSNLFRIALPINENTRRVHRYHAGATTLRRPRADKKIRGIPPRHCQRASCALSGSSAERRDRAGDLWVVAASLNRWIAREVRSMHCQRRLAANKQSATAVQSCHANQRAPVRKQCDPRLSLTKLSKLLAVLMGLACLSCALLGRLAGLRKVSRA